MIEHIKKDRDDGTQGPWVVESDGHYPVIRKNFRVGHHMNVCGPVHGYMYSENERANQSANARRITRTPELEDYCLEAHELLKIVLAGECVNYAYIAPRNIERIKKLVGEA